MGRWINYFQPELVPPAIFLTAGLALIAFVVANLLRFVLRAPSVDADVLCASISAYLMLGLLWTIAYWLVDQLTPGAFSLNTTKGTKRRWRIFHLLFSFIALGTVGYGDIAPISKSLACATASHDRVALCRGPDCAVGRPLFDSKISMMAAGGNGVNQSKIAAQEETRAAPSWTKVLLRARQRHAATIVVRQL